MDFKFKFKRARSTSLEERCEPKKSSDYTDVQGVHDNQQLREADAKLKDFIDRQSCAQSFDWLSDSILVLLIAFMCWVQGEVVLAIVFSVFTVCLLVYKHYALRSFSLQISDSRLNAGVLYKIMLGPDELGKIYQYVPIPWRWFFLMLRPKKVADWVFLVAQNLAWYQQEPRFYLPARWIIQTVLGVIAACFGAMVVFGKSQNYDGHEFLYCFIAFNTVMILVGLGQRMKLAGAIELRAELKTVLPARKRTPLKGEDI